MPPFRTHSCDIWELVEGEVGTGGKVLSADYTLLYHDVPCSFHPMGGMEKLEFGLDQNKDGASWYAALDAIERETLQKGYILRWNERGTFWRVSQFPQEWDSVRGHYFAALTIEPGGTRLPKSIQEHYA